MASEFIGYKIVVVSKGPPPAQWMQGTVANVIDQKLILNDVTLPSNGQYLPFYEIDSSQIADLQIVPPQPTLPLVRTDAEANHLESNRPLYRQPQTDAPLPRASSKPFVDPAILSFSKPSLNARNVSSDSQWSRYSQPDAISPVMIADSIARGSRSAERYQSQYAPPFIQTPQSASLSAHTETQIRTSKDRRDSSATATLTKPFDHMALNEDDGNVAGEEKKRHVSAPGRGKKNASSTEQKASTTLLRQQAAANDPRNPKSSKKGVKAPGAKGEGWRQTPLVEDATPAKSKSRKRRPIHGAHKSVLEDTNGWATEDATDIQDLGEFDFEHNLSKFDKRRVFDDIGKDDKIAEDDRLVSFNRKVRPGTNGGRNLHHAENVLDMPDATGGPWRDTTGETDEDEPQYSGGRASRRDQPQWPLPSRRGTLLGPKQSSAASPLSSSVSSFRASLRLTSTNKACTCVTPLQMLEIEQLCTSELGLTDEILYENAGRGIAEAALTLPSDLPGNPTILFLIGNHKSGCRAVAAARHLRNHNIRVSICVLGGERQNMLLESLKRQLDIYQKSGGWLLRWDEFQSKISSTTSSADKATPDLIVDALLGMHVTFSEQRTDDQAIAFEMIRWANRTTVAILSVDVPSGLHASSGDITLVDSTPLIIHATFIACMGAPKSGLIAALASGEGRSRDWRKLCVVDMGISNVAWKKFGSRRRHGVDFGKQWVVPLKFVGAGATGRSD